MCDDIYVWCQIARNLPTYEDIFALRNTCAFLRNSREYCAMIAQILHDNCADKLAVCLSLNYVTQRAIVARADILFDHMTQICDQYPFAHLINMECYELAIVYCHDRAVRYFRERIRGCTPMKHEIAFAIWNASDAKSGAKSDDIWDVARFLHNVAKIPTATICHVIDERENFAQMIEANASYRYGIYVNGIRHVNRDIKLCARDFRAILRGCSRTTAIQLLEIFACKACDSSCDRHYDMQFVQFITYISSVLVTRDDSRDIIAAVSNIPEIIIKSCASVIAHEWWAIIVMQAARRGNAICDAYFDRFLHFAPTRDYERTHKVRGK